MNWGKGILVFLIVFILLNVVFLIFSFNQKVDLVTDNYYEKELKYQTEIDNEILGNSIAEKINITFDINRLVIDMEGIDNKLSGVVYFYKPNNNKKDFEIAIDLSEKKVYEILMNRLDRGKWRVFFNLNEGNNNFKVVKEIFI